MPPRTAGRCWLRAVSCSHACFSTCWRLLLSVSVSFWRAWLSPNCCCPAQKASLTASSAHCAQSCSSPQRPVLCAQCRLSAHQLSVISSSGGLTARRCFCPSANPQRSRLQRRGRPCGRRARGTRTPRIESFCFTRIAFSGWQNIICTCDPGLVPLGQ